MTSNINTDTRMQRENMAAQQPPRPTQQQPQAQQQSGQNEGNGLVSGYLGFVPSTENLKFIQDNKLLFLSSKTEVVNPQDESFFDMLKINFCPLLNCLSVTTVILLGCTIFYIVAVAKGFLQSGTLLQVNSATLFELGMNNSRLVYHSQVWRLTVNFFLHVNIAHMVTCFVVLLLVVPSLQYTFGSFVTLLALIVSGITASIFSDILNTSNDTLKIGLNPILFASLGIGVGYLLVNWSSLSFIGPIFKFKIISNLFFSLIFLIIFADQANKGDAVGQVGGFLAGFLFTGMLPSLRKETPEIIIRVILTILFWIMLLACILFFYLLPQSSYSS